MYLRHIENKTSMNQFNINSVIEHYGLNIEELAKVLFPNVKYPKLAFDRIIKGEANLDITQIEVLASYIGVLVQDLFSVDTWKASYEDNCFTVTKGAYKVKLNYNGVFMFFYKDNKPIGENITNAPSMTIKEFVNYIDNFIKNYENGDN